MALKTSEWRAERNRKALARLQKALPKVFPATVLAHALRRPFIPPMPRLAIDAYWRAHPLRADRLARALAAKSGTPTSLGTAPQGWTLNAVADFDSNGWQDLAFREASTGHVFLWHLNALEVTDSVQLVPPTGSSMPLNWSLIGPR